MLRFLLLGLLLVGFGVGFRNQWLELHWARFLDDVGLPVPSTDEGFDFNRWLIGDPDSEPAPN